MNLKKLIAVGGIGLASLLFLLVGAIFLLVASGLQRADIQRVERLSPLSRIQLADTQEGTEVLVVGTVAATNIPVTGRYIAYVHEERERRGDEHIWLEQDSVKPPFTMDVNGGPVLIQNGDYGHRYWHIDGLAIDERYTYLEAGDEIFVVGTLAERSEVPKLTVDFIALGTPENYLTQSRQSAGVFGILGWIMLSIGAITFALALLVGFRSEIKS